VRSAAASWPGAISARAGFVWVRRVFAALAAGHGDHDLAVARLVVVVVVVVVVEELAC